MPYNILLVDDDKSFRAEFRACFSEYNFVEASGRTIIIGRNECPDLPIRS
jgi:hypothetical protein